uniref:Uncharacterized protein n=1 Tax=Avena sativa TaxID=4498 RepID=A0ACD5VRP6_AVESA
MIRDLKVAKQEQDIGFYAGFVGATYFLARTIGAVPWGMFADKYGRKPCIVISILSVIVFNTLFGLSTTYWMAIVTRGLLGLLCGILGPIKAYASEVCRKEHQALGISLVTSSRAIAFVIGPAIGGFLSQVLSILILATYPFMANLYGMELKVLINIASLLKNIFAATITTACNILQNTAVRQEQRGVANGISVTLMSIFKTVGPAAAGILFSWSQKNVTGLFLPGDQILFLLLNMVAVIGLSLTFKPFFSVPSAMK